MSSRKERPRPESVQGRELNGSAVPETKTAHKPAGSGGRPHEEELLPTLIDGCFRRDPSSQERLYKLYYGYALAIALKYCLNRDDAIEVVNDSFMKVFQKIETYDRSRPFRPWLSRIVINRSIDMRRRHFRPHHNIEEIPIQGEISADDGLNVKEIHQLLEKLPDLQRFVFNMYEIDGYSHREIAEMLDIAESSSRTYLTRAKTRLRALYRKHLSGRRES